MKNVNIILSILSLNAFLTILERLSFTTNILLQPYNFLRLHEVIQITIFILVSVIGSFLILKYVSKNFENIKDTKGTVYAVLFVAGTYFYGLGEGLHEVASYFFNTYCDTKHIVGNACGSMFFNDYYTGNIYFFVGLFMSTIALLLLERRNPQQKVSRNDLIIVIVNSLVFAFTLIAYASFDPVLVGISYIAITAVVCAYLALTAKSKITHMPFTLYAVTAYLVALIVTSIIRFH